ncbi:recombinase family protein [Endozoicomonas sp. G2_1]|uniref:recombinase family protein n=1 Tax=Endozoicomonas sp. G2_1 TaxID=2821091 RepID=UPI001ADC3E65|nr:recombinase family protein [Endozoicomonas sp. G2_1]MBO9492468.1 recombinase family protein [Endozoicomonas sp. G2_1]
MSNNVQVYSYVRWSSDRQADGSTKQRQLKIAEKVAQEKGFELVTFYDKGVSAFKGKKRVDGALGNFIRKVELGEIPNNSWLVVENLDL